MSPWITPRTVHIFSHLTTSFGDVARLLITKHPMSKTVNKPV
jgi:hypothetical protein